MPHDLEILADGSASMMYNYEEGVPWHGLGNPVYGAVTAETAIKEANLDWEVEIVPVYAYESDTYEMIPGRFRVRRKTDGKTLGIVGKDYKPIQNAEAFSFFDTLVDSGDAKYQTAGSLAGGKRVWMTARVGDDIEIAGQDAHRLYLTLVSSHDGSKSLSAVTSMIRVVCANTETMAFRSAKTSWTMTHRQTLEGKVHEARDALKIGFKYRDEFEKEVQRLMDIPVTVDQFRDVMRDVLPKQKRQLDKNLEALTYNFESSPSIVDAGIGGTAWGAFNATTEWLTWGREVRSQEARMVNTIWGFGSQVRNKTRDRLLALA